MHRTLLLLPLLVHAATLFTTSSARANGIQISNVRLVERNTDAGPNHPDIYCYVQFDIRWENSWRTTSAPGNWDAAWVFIKIRQDGAIIRSIDTSYQSSTATIRLNDVTGLYTGMPLRIIRGSGSFPTSCAAGYINTTGRSMSVLGGFSQKNPTEGDSIEFQHLWRHVEPAASGHYPGDGTPAELRTGRVDVKNPYHATDNPNVGVFLQRSGTGTGTFEVTGVRIKWNYGLLGLRDDEMVRVRVFGIEMVYIPQGAFYVGDGVASDVAGQLGQAGSTWPFLIDGEHSIGLGGNVNTNIRSRIGNQDVPDDFNTTTLQTLPAAYPKGFAAFHVMKHEIGQKLYVDFLNTLTYQQQQALTGNGTPSSAPGTAAMVSGNLNRNGIDVRNSGVDGHLPAIYACNLDDQDFDWDTKNDGLYLAANYLRYDRMINILDWAGLRPLSELEFEKACRGPEYPVPGEYPWGSTSVVTTRYVLGSPAGDTELTVTNPGTGNALHDATTPGNGPLRHGLFAGPSTDRSTSGASYYGVMDLAGNVNERVVTMGRSAGRTFNGIHGNGALIYDAFPFVYGWPYEEGIGIRGGSWQQLPGRMRVSDRWWVNTGTGLVNNERHGVRGARTAE